MISNRDLQLLQAYNDRGYDLLSTYLPLDTPARRQAAYDQFARQVQACLDNRDPAPVNGETIQEDIEIVRLYLNCNASRCGAGLAIFSCASELFWRAYSLPVPVPTHVAVGPRFDIEPLLQVVESQTHKVGSGTAKRKVASILS